MPSDAVIVAKSAHLTCGDTVQHGVCLLSDSFGTKRAE
jgi:hypothetical protein